MLKRNRSRLAALLAATALSLGAAAAPAMAQGPLVTGGLVNVTITDVLSGNQVTVQVPIGVAANVCGVQANVLAADVRQNGSAQCTASSDLDTSALPTAFRP